MLLLGTVYTSAVVDGDLYWQMAYGRELLQNGSLVPDHTVFTWSKSWNEVIYCAWISEIGFYKLYQMGGMNLLYLFRYLLLLVVAGGIVKLGRDAKASSAVIVAYLTLYLLGSAVGGYLKPELASLFFHSLTVLALYGYKTAPESRFWRRAFWLSPLYILLWVNSHGGFIFASVLYGGLLVGECLNYLTKRSAALPGSELKRIAAVCLGVGVAVFITPYGYRYPLELIKDRIFSENNEAMMDHVAAWKPTLSPLFATLMMREIFFCLVLLTLVTLARARKVDFTYILHNLLFGCLFLAYIRSSYFWPIVAIASNLYLARELKGRFGKVVEVVAVLMAVLLSGRAAYLTVVTPPLFQYWGIGPAYNNPVLSATLVKSLPPQARLANDYGTGGYLMWELYPDRKVMIDPRGFPFRKWWPLYLEFASGKDIDHFLDATKCRVAVLHLKMESTIGALRKSPNWRPVLLEPGAVVFFHRDLTDETLAEKLQIQAYGSLKHREAGRITLETALKLSRFDWAEQYLERMRQLGASDEEMVELERAVKAKLAVHEKRYDDAILLYEELLANHQLKGLTTLQALYKWKLEEASRLGDQAKISEMQSKLKALEKKP